LEPPKIESPLFQPHSRYTPPDHHHPLSFLAAQTSPISFHRTISFLPERWLANTADEKSAFQPFSVSTRNCIGRNLAEAEMRLILARVLWNSDLELANAVEEDWMRGQKA